MIRALFKGLGRLALLLATMAFLAAVAIFVLGGFLLTWPILRLSPRDRKIKATMDFAQAGMTLLTVFSEASVKKMMEDAIAQRPTPQKDEDPDDGEPEIYVSDWSTH